MSPGTTPYSRGRRAFRGTLCSYLCRGGYSGKSSKYKIRLVRIFSGLWTTTVLVGVCRCEPTRAAAWVMKTVMAVAAMTWMLNFMMANSE